MDLAEALDRLSAGRVARFASITPDGRPHVVAVTYALVDSQLVHMVDEKPKRHRRLQRVRNVEANPYASLLLDHYEEEWSALWWVRVDGEARVEEDGEGWESARAALVEKYHQYRRLPPAGPAVFLSIDRLTHWEGS